LKELNIREPSKMPYPENALLRRRSQILTEAEAKTELDPVDLHDGRLAGFFERLARFLRKIAGKK
jgi:hypothetical protein